MQIFGDLKIPYSDILANIYVYEKKVHKRLTKHKQISVTFRDSPVTMLQCRPLLVNSAV